MITWRDLRQRHRLVWLDAEQWRQQLERHAWTPPARACLSHWSRQHLPLVVTRQPSPVQAELYLGLPMPNRWGRGRLTLSVPLSAIRSVGHFPSAEAAVRVLPPTSHRRWQALCAHWRAGGCQVRVYGSHGWQLISGEDCVREGSDLDLIIPVRDAHHADVLADALDVGHVSGLPNVDGELVFPDHSAVHWREWRQWRRGRVDEILVKRLQGVRLHTTPWWPHTPLPADMGRHAPRSCRTIGDAAVHALHDELALAAKPGLVSFEDNGSHQDMDAALFMRSLLALRGYFIQIAELGFQCAPFASLQACGRAAEQRMREATGGVNTHRGAIFMLGLMCAAAGRVLACGEEWSADAIRVALREHWGMALLVHATVATSLPGGHLARRHGLNGAAWQAARGFPVVFEVGMPAMMSARASGLCAAQAQLQSFFAMLAVLDDSNLVCRGGLAGLRFAQAAAVDFLRRGGAAAGDAQARARRLHQGFVARGLSPGGVADALAATCWLMRLVGRR